MNIDATFAAGAAGAFWRTQNGLVHPDKPERFRYTGLSFEWQRFAEAA